MFALGDTLAANALRCLALIASHPGQLREVLKELDGDGPGPYLGACLQDAMRLWPTTPLLSREVLEDTRLGGTTVPAGTQVMFSNLLNHRDRSRHEFADRFSPERWTEGNAAEDWSFNHFSHGPQGCPGTGIALLVGKAMIAELLSNYDVAPVSPKLDPDKPLPHMVDFFGIRLKLTPRGAG